MLAKGTQVSCPPTDGSKRINERGEKLQGECRRKISRVTSSCWAEPGQIELGAHTGSDVHKHDLSELNSIDRIQHTYQGALLA